MYSSSPRYSSMHFTDRDPLNNIIEQELGEDLILNITYHEVALINTASINQ